MDRPLGWRYRWAWMVAFEFIGRTRKKTNLTCGDTQEQSGLVCVLEHGVCRQNGGKEVRHPATAGGMQSRSPPAERRPRLRGEARGRHQIPMARPAHIPEIGPRRLRDAPPDVRGASVIQKGRARDVAVRVAHGPVTWIFRHPAPEQGRAPPNTHGLRSSEAPTRGRLVGGSGTHGATGAARRDRPQVTERNPGTAPQRRRRGGREARSSSGVRVASAASGARGPTGRPRNRTSRRRHLRRG